MMMWLQRLIAQGSSARTEATREWLDCLDKPLEHAGRFIQRLRDDPQALHQIEPTEGQSLLHALADCEVAPNQAGVYRNLVEHVTQRLQYTDFTQACQRYPYQTAFELALSQQYKEGKFFSWERQQLIEALLRQGRDDLFRAADESDPARLKAILNVYPPLVNDAKGNAGTIVGYLLELRDEGRLDNTNYADLVSALMHHSEPYFFGLHEGQEDVLSLARKLAKREGSTKPDQDFYQHLQLRAEQQKQEPERLAVLLASKRRCLKNISPFKRRTDWVYYQQALPGDVVRPIERVVAPARSKMPSDAVFAYFAEQVYFDVQGQTTVLPEGWSYHGVPEEGRHRGWMLYWYQPDGASRVTAAMLAFSGEQQPAGQGIITADSPLGAALERDVGAAAESMGDLLTDGLRMIGFVRRNHPHAVVCLTGHGLGGWLAQWALLLHQFTWRDDEGEHDACAVVFDSARVDGLRVESGDQTKMMLAGELNLRRYQICPNLVNVSGGPPVENVDYRIFTADVGADPRMMRDMSSLARSFDPVTGFPFIYKRVLSWPESRLSEPVSTRARSPDLAPSDWEGLLVFYVNQNLVKDSVLESARQLLAGRQPEIAAQGWDFDSGHEEPFSLMAPPGKYATTSILPASELALKDMPLVEQDRVRALERSRKDIEIQVGLPDLLKDRILGFKLVGDARGRRLKVLTGQAASVWLHHLEAAFAEYAVLVRRVAWEQTRLERKRGYDRAYHVFLSIASLQLARLRRFDMLCLEFRLYQAWLSCVYWERTSAQPLFGPRVALDAHHIRVSLLKWGAADGTSNRGDTTSEAAGREIDLENLFSPTSTSGSPSRLPALNETTRRSLGGNSPLAVLCIGDPGAGKTVLTQYVAAQWVARNLYRDFDWVFRLSCRAMGAIRAPSDTDSFTDTLVDCIYWQNFAGSGLALEDFKRWISLKSLARTLIVLDGLDEEPRPNPYQGMVEHLLSGRARCSVLATTRPHAADRMLHPDKIVVIDGFKPDHVRRYVGQFIDDCGVGRTIFGDHIRPEQAKIEMLRYIESRAELHRLARSPLVLNILCGILLGGTHPDDSLHCQGRVIGLLQHLEGLLLLRARQRELGYIPAGDHRQPAFLRAYYSEALVKLRKLAFLAMQNDTIVLNKALLDEVMGCDDVIKQQLALGFLSGPLVEKSEPLDRNMCAEFYHLLIQEYFAACYIAQSFLRADELVISQLKRPDHPNFRMVYPMVAGQLAGRDKAFARFRAFIEPYMAHELAGDAVLGVVVRCIDEAGQVAHAWRDTLMSKVQQKVYEVYQENRRREGGLMEGDMAFAPGLIEALRHSSSWSELTGEQDLLVRVLPELVEGDIWRRQGEGATLDEQHFRAAAGLGLPTVGWARCLLQGLAAFDSVQGKRMLVLMACASGTRDKSLVAVLQSYLQDNPFLLISGVFALHRLNVVEDGELIQGVLDWVARLSDPKDVRASVLLSTVFLDYGLRGTPEQHQKAGEYFMVRLQCADDFIEIARLLRALDRLGMHDPLLAALEALQERLSVLDFLNVVDYLASFRGLNAPLLQPLVISALGAIQSMGELSEQAHMLVMIERLFHRVSQMSVAEHLERDLAALLLKFLDSKSEKTALEGTLVCLSVLKREPTWAGELLTTEQAKKSLWHSIVYLDVHPDDKEVREHLLRGLMPHDIGLAKVLALVVLSEKKIQFQRAKEFRGAKDWLLQHTLRNHRLFNDRLDEKVDRLLCTWVKEAPLQFGKKLLDLIDRQTDSVSCFVHMLAVVLRATEEPSLVARAVGKINQLLLDEYDESQVSPDAASLPLNLLEFLEEIRPNNAKILLSKLDWFFLSYIRLCGSMDRTRIVMLRKAVDLKLSDTRWALAFLSGDWATGSVAASSYFAGSLAEEVIITGGRLPFLLTLLCGAFHSNDFSIRLTSGGLGSQHQHALVGQAGNRLIDISLSEREYEWFLPRLDAIQRAARSRDREAFVELYQAAEAVGANVLDDAAQASAAVRHVMLMSGKEGHPSSSSAPQPVKQGTSRAVAGASMRS